MDDTRLRTEAIRVYQRYAIEVVEALGLCPWARRARLDGRVRCEVELAAEPRLERLLPRLAALANDPDTDITLLIFPRLHADPRQFRQFMSEIRDGHTADCGAQTNPLLMADFHPDGEPDMASPARLISFIRRTPDPTIQLVRRTALDGVKRSADEGTVYDPRVLTASLQELLDQGPPPPPTHERVAEVNHATVVRFGVDRMRALLDDIRADRDRAYAALTAPDPR